MLELLLTSLFTSLLTLLGACLLLHQPAKVALAPAGQSVDTVDSDGSHGADLGELDASDEERFLKESGHDRPLAEVNASVAEIDAIRRSFTRVPPPRLEPSARGRVPKGRTLSTGAPRPIRTSRTQCRKCDKEFVDEVALRQHQVFKHSGGGSLSGGLPAKFSSESSSSLSSMPIACVVCRRECKSPASLRQHKADEHPWSLYCVACRVKFGSANQATQHYTTSSAHMPRPKRTSPRKPVESGNYVPFEGFNPDPNIPEVQQTYGCGECKERFNSAKERDDHMKDLFAHPDPIALASAFPPLSSAYSPTFAKTSPVTTPPNLEDGLGLGVELSSRHGIALDRMPLPFEHVARQPSNVIDFEDDEASLPVVELERREIIMEVDAPALPFTSLERGPIVAVDFDDEIPPPPQAESALDEAIELTPSKSSSIHQDQSASNTGSFSPSESKTSSAHSPPVSPRKAEGSASLLSPALSDGSSPARPWYSPKPLSPSQVHPDAGIVWGIPWSPPVPGPESYPPLNGKLPSTSQAIWGPPLASPRLAGPTSPRLSDYTAEETPPPETPPAPPIVPSPKDGITPGRWSIGEKSDFPMPDLTPRIKQRLTYDLPSVDSPPVQLSPPVADHAPLPKPDDITAPYVQPTRLSGPLWSDEPIEHVEAQYADEGDEDFPIVVSSANSIPLPNRRSKLNHYRMGPDGAYPNNPPITIPLPSPRKWHPKPQPTSPETAIEEQVPLFRHPKAGAPFAGYAPPGPTPAPPRAAAIAAWSKAPKVPAPPPSCEPTIHSSWLPTPPPTTSSSPTDNAPRRKAPASHNRPPKKGQFQTTLEPTFDPEEWFTESTTTRKKSVVKMQPRRGSPAPRLTFAQRTAAAAAAKQPRNGVSRGAYEQVGRSKVGGPVGSSDWAAEQQAAVVTASAADEEDYGGW